MPATTLRPMTPAHFSAFLQSSIPAYAQEKVTSGQWAPSQALQQARQAFDELLPQGLATPHHHLYAIHGGAEGEGVPVGVLWIAEQDRGTGRAAYVYEVSIDPAHQRQGHASRAFAALEDEVRRLGLNGIGLNVFGHNHGARALYEKLGYAPTSITMFKRLDAG